MKVFNSTLLTVLICQLSVFGQPLLIDNKCLGVSISPFPQTSIINPEFITKYKVKRIVAQGDEYKFSLNNKDVTLPISEPVNTHVWEFNVHGQISKEILVYEDEMLEQPDTILSVLYVYDIHSRLIAIREFRESRELRIRKFKYQDALLTKVEEEDRNGYSGNNLKFYYNDDQSLKKRVEYIEHNKFQVEYFYPKDVDQEVIDFLVETELKQEDTGILIVYFTENDRILKEFRFTENGSYKSEYQFTEEGKLSQSSQLAYGMLIQQIYQYDSVGNLDEDWQSRTNSPNYKTDYIYDKKGVFLNEVIEMEGDILKGSTVFSYDF